MEKSETKYNLKKMGIVFSEEKRNGYTILLLGNIYLGQDELRRLGQCDDLEWLESDKNGELFITLEKEVKK